MKLSNSRTGASVLPVLLNAHPVIVVSINFFVCGTIAFLITWVLKRSPLCFIIGEARK